MDVLKRVPVREQDAQVRAKNFEEVCYGYNEEEAVAEAERCLNCKNAMCVKGCPVSIDIPAFIQEVKNRNFEEAYQIISKSSALPAVCGRVCPQESQCEGKCIRGFKGEPVSIGKLERFVADWARENGIKPNKAEKMNGHKVAVIGSGPAGLTCAGDLAKLGYEVTVFQLILIMALALIASMGTPAAPGAGAVILFTILSGVGFTGDQALIAYSLILAINRPIEMLVTSLNCVGDSVAAIAVAKSEEKLDVEIYNT